MNMPFAIETTGLFKRYPTSVRNVRGMVGGGRRISGGIGRIDSFGGMLGVLRGIKGPYVEALRGVDLQIKEGEIFGVLGPNGAGKTTLIKILCTLVIHDEGQVYVQGIDVKKEPNKVLKNLQAVLPESRGFDWRLTGRQNLEFYSLLYALPDKETRKRIDYLLALTGLESRADDGYQRYSTGMQRKLLLCRALLRNTPILLFDEPTAGLDPKSASEFRELLRDRLVRQEKKTIVLSTHNLQEAQSVCDRIAILDHGKIKVCDSPDNIRHTILNEKICNITLINAVFNDNNEKVIESLKTLPGIKSVMPEKDSESKIHRLLIRMSKQTEISDILGVVVNNGLRIDMINTTEPTLEDAFMAITARQDDYRKYEAEV